MCIRDSDFDLLSGAKLSGEFSALAASDTNPTIYLAVPFDFHTLPAKRRKALVKLAGGPNRLLVCPDLCCRLDADAAQKINRGEYIRP